VEKRKYWFTVFNGVVILLLCIANTRRISRTVTTSDYYKIVVTIIDYTLNKSPLIIV